MSDIANRLEEIKALRAELAEKTAAVRADVIAQIKELRSKLEIDPVDLAKEFGLKLEGSAAPVRKPVAPKYRGPNGEEWSGRGRQPSWVLECLKNGYTLDDLKIK